MKVYDICSAKRSSHALQNSTTKSFRAFIQITFSHFEHPAQFSHLEVKHAIPS